MYMTMTQVQTPMVTLTDEQLHAEVAMYQGGADQLWRETDVCGCMYVCMYDVTCATSNDAGRCTNPGIYSHRTAGRVCV